MKSDSHSARPYRRSSSFKIALFLALLLGISASIFTYFLYQFNESSLNREVESGIDSIMSAFEGWNVPEFDLADRVSLLERMQSTPSGTFYIYFDESNNVLYADINAPEQEITTLVEGLILFDIDPSAILRGPPLPENVRRPLAGKFRSFEDGSSLLIAQDIGDELDSRQLMRTLGIITISLMFTGIVISFFISSKVVARTNSIARTSREIIETGDLSRRIEVDSNWDDLSNLAEILNNMLDRIERLMDGVRRVSDNIAHDLRTPLGRMRGNLEHLLAKAEKDNDQELQDFAERLTSEADHLLQTFGALLRIANIESGKLSRDFSQTSITSMAEDVIDLYAPLAEEKNLILDVELEDAHLNCDRNLLFQAVANVLDNAIKFSSPDGHVKIQLVSSGNTVKLTVADQGQGVSDEDKEKVFQRFYRAESSRNTSGVGLGLSLVEAIIDLHGGDIVLKNNNPGLIVDISLPTKS